MYLCTMRIALHTILALLLFVSNTGIGYASHFCGGQLVASHLGHTAQAPDCSGSSQELFNDPSHSKPCCDDTQFVVTTDDIAPASTIAVASQVVLVLPHWCSHAFAKAQSSDSTHTAVEPLPDPPQLYRPVSRILYDTWLI